MRRRVNATILLWGLCIGLLGACGVKDSEQMSPIAEDESEECMPFGHIDPSTGKLFDLGGMGDLCMIWKMKLVL